ncbi:hypothetical protein [Nocardiopsis sp. NPDC058789]|uniref:Uncharacterized protein n=1 Tax=Nocardiopsis eucommiae TaxID=2831970 RepID=A0A975LC37_9ACTN|nr:hypothetical protein KGD82_08690 [Nocardiopsis eucommiae]
MFHPDFVLRDDRARSEAAARRSEQLTAVRRARAEARARARERAAKRRRRAS